MNYLRNEKIRKKLNILNPLYRRFIGVLKIRKSDKIELKKF